MWIDVGGETFPLDALLPYDPLEDGLPCVACGEVMEDAPPARLFCDSYCKAVATTVRYRRRKEREGFRKRTDWDDVLMAIRTQESFVIAGAAYDRGRRIQGAQRDAVFDAKGRTCVKCGAPATDIDHIDGTDLSSVENLAPLCHHCHLVKSHDDQYGPVSAEAAMRSLAVLETLASPEVVALAKASGVPVVAVQDDECLRRYADYLRRVYAEPPRLCDDEKRWDSVWRRIQKEPYMRLPNWWIAHHDS
jgi:hypothetical protein